MEMLQLIKDQKRAVRVLHETFTKIMPQWKPYAQLHQGKNLNQGTNNTAARADHLTIIFEHLMHDDA